MRASPELRVEPRTERLPQRVARSLFESTPQLIIPFDFPSRFRHGRAIPPGFYLCPTFSKTYAQPARFMTYREK